MDSFRFKKKYGQNFLKDNNILEKIVKVSNIEDKSLIIEVGPGNGALTEKLINTGNNVISYEIDNELEEVLRNKFSDKDNFRLIMGDFLEKDVNKDIESYDYSNLYVIANLPYYITTPILEKIVNEIDVKKLVIMVQKEVGERLSATPGNRDYGSLTVFLNYHYDIKKEFIVNRNSFYPAPHVDSMIVSLTKKDKKLDVNNLDLFYKIVRDSFQFKRKNLKNNLKNYNLDKINNVLLNYGYDLNVRAEELKLEVFVDIANNL